MRKHDAYTVKGPNDSSVPAVVDYDKASPSPSWSVTTEFIRLADSSRDSS